MSESRAPAATSLVIRQPVDLIALAPIVLGFRPEESVVLETFGGPRGSFHARGDLPRGHADQDTLAEQLAAAALRNGAAQAGVVVFSDNLARARRQGRALRDRLREVGIEVIDVLCADGSRFHGLDGRGSGGSGGEGGEGIAYDLESHPFTVENVFAGAVVHESRADLAATLVGADEEDRAAVARAAAAVDVVLLGREAKRAEALWIQGRIRGFRRTRAPLTAVEAGRLLAVCDDDDLHDVAWAEMTREHGDAHVQLWTDLVRRAPAATIGRAAGLLAFAAWLHGDGALAWCAVERARAQRAGPERARGGLAEHVAVALMEAVPPSSWEPFSAEVLGAFGPFRAG